MLPGLNAMGLAGQSPKLTNGGLAGQLFGFFGFKIGDLQGGEAVAGGIAGGAGTTTTLDHGSLNAYNAPC